MPRQRLQLHGDGAPLSPLRGSGVTEDEKGMLRLLPLQQRREAPVSPEVQTPEALHGLQQAVLQAAVPQQQQRGQVRAVCLPTDPRTSAQASQSPPG
ncbi:hypothetical protein EYF80_029879 [Liparis tanakae]|uniref:Uncharacterized protein n=1 Tax=Liparis tanakae TaxID=230148 RepID=A0A4Z2H495_9TELE|nr:hypothetical protein EYF80_029879 [Liparis tanakae]